MTRWTRLLHRLTGFYRCLSRRERVQFYSALWAVVDLFDRGHGEATADYLEGAVVMLEDEDMREAYRSN